jgi:DNA primase catalytic subunit
MATSLPFIDPRISEETLNRVVTCGERFPFCQREFAADLANSDGTTTYFKRHMSFGNAAALMQFARGANVKSMHMGASSFADQTHRELVFDFDVTDMKDVCACDCAERRSACSQCWLYERLAMHTLQFVLVEDFGLEARDIEFYFSGNRGFHCYVTAEKIGSLRVATMSNDQRRVVAERFKYESQSQRLGIAQAQLLNVFDEFYTEHIYPVHKAKLGEECKPCGMSEKEIMALCWPKFDSRVTADIGHLLRMPFSLNPKSGRYVQRIPTEDVHLLDYVPAVFSVE